MNKLLPYFNDENVRKYIKSPDKVLSEKLDSDEFKSKLCKYYSIHRENLILKHVCKDLEADFMKLRTLSSITNLSEHEFLEMLVRCFVDNIDNDIKKLLTHAYRKYQKKFNPKN